MENSRTLILILISVGLFYTFISPQYQDVKVLGVEASEYRKVLSSASTIGNIVNDLSERYRQFPPEEIDRLEKALPDNADVVRLALDLDSMANKYGISVSSVSTDVSGGSGSSFADAGKTSSHNKTMVSFGFVSSYSSFKGFLTELEQSLRVADVRSLSFQVGDANFYQHTMTLETYWVD